MNEYDDIEERLRRLQPTGPPAELRERVRAAAALAKRSPREWLPPLTVAAAAIVLYALAGLARTDALGSRSPGDQPAAAAVQDLAEQLGGGPLAEYIASNVVSMELAEEARVE